MKGGLSARTPAQREEHIQYLMKLPLKELRRRQDLVSAQWRRAFENCMRESKSEFKCVRDNANAKWERTFQNLDQMGNDLIEAIDRKEFPIQPNGGVGGTQEQPAYGAAN